MERMGSRSLVEEEEEGEDGFLQVPEAEDCRKGSLEQRGRHLLRVDRTIGQNPRRELVDNCCMPYL